MSSLRHRSSSSAAPLGETLGRVAGRYTLERLLGKGGTAAVYVAVDAFDGRRVALKRLSAGASGTARTLFEREYQVLVSLRHRAIVEAYDYGCDDHGPYYSMELIEGTELRKQAPVPWRLACTHLRDIASILGLLHARELLHRDLAPRNLLCTPQGGLKLIDFGAVAPFGPSRDVAGTPPFVPPEGLGTGALDQRYDLFSLGALGYWLITGKHAFPARKLEHLPRMWERPPPVASQLVARHGNQDADPVPPELDQLLEALLHRDRAERPANTAELMDRLYSIVDLAPEAQREATEGYLNSKAFVGRQRERARVRMALQATRTGSGKALLVESSSGFGRTRFLAEACTLARLDGVLALSVEATRRERPYAAVAAVAQRAFASLPEQARGSLLARAPDVSHLWSPLACPQVPLSDAAPTSFVRFEPVRLQAILEDLLFSLAATQPVLLAIDDFHLRDEPSQAALMTLARTAGKHPLLLVAAAASGGREEPSAALVGLRAAATRVHLPPLAADEVRDLLRSVFGSPPYLERLATRLFRTCEGHPGHCLELARHLVKSGLVQYEDGSWVLPAELSPNDLPPDRAAGHRVWIERLSSEARAFARLLSVPHRGDFTRGACAALAQGLDVDLEAVLSELVHEGVLIQSPAGFRVVHPDLQERLLAELPPSDRRQAHNAIAGALLAEGPEAPHEFLCVALHLLHTGNTRTALPLINKAAAALARSDAIDAPHLRVASFALCEIDALLSAQGADEHARSEPLSMLALAGYFVDNRYAVRYGEQAVTVLEQRLKLSIARRLAPVLGRKLSLYTALGVAGVAMLIRGRRGPRLVPSIRRLVQVCSALSGTSACCIDPLRIAELARTIEPFTALGEKHAAGVAHRFIHAILSTVEDFPTPANEKLRSLIALLESDTPIQELEPTVREQLLAGALFALGANESLREGDEVLKIADRLDSFGQLYAMSADHLRGAYHAQRGDLQRFECYRQRVELHAVQLGTTWQVETWAAESAIPRAQRLFDAMLLKRALRELTRLSQDVPSLARAAKHARGNYLVMREKYAEAIPFLEDDEPPGQYIGWSGYHGALARAYNELGQHGRAREICRRVMSHLAPGDLDYVTQNGFVQIELGVAEAGLGNTGAAHAHLDALFARFEPFENPLTMVGLYEGRIRACLRGDDLVRARTEHVQLSKYCRKLAIPSLIQLAGKFDKLLARTERHQDGAPAEAVDPGWDSTAMMTRARMAHAATSDSAILERALHGLQVALEHTTADAGFIALPTEAGGNVVHLGGEPPGSELVAWARERMATAIQNGDADTVATEPGSTRPDSNYKLIGRMHYCIIVLERHKPSADLVAGSLVLAFDGRVPCLPPPDVVRSITESLISRGE